MTTQKLSAQEREAFEAFKAWLRTEYHPSWPKMTADETGLMWDAWKGSRAAMAVQPQERIDPEALILACVPGGYSCDPQAVADAIRAYFAAPQPQGDHLTKMVRLSEELGLYDGAGAQEFDAGLGEPSKMQDAAKLPAAGVPASAEEQPPCPVCGGTERSRAGYLLCECPAESLKPARGVQAAAPAMIEDDDGSRSLALELADAISNHQYGLRGFGDGSLSRGRDLTQRERLTIMAALRAYGVQEVPK